MMVDYLKLQLQGAPDQRMLVDALKNSLPLIGWRSGDSDAQGRYIKGYHPAGAAFAFWLDDGPALLTLDYRRVAPERKREVGVVDQTLRALLADLRLLPSPKLRA